MSRIGFHGDEHGGHSIHARKAIEAGEMVLDIPLRCMITLESAKASAIGRAIASSGASPNTQTWLAAFVLEERHFPDSFWRRYLATLPKSFPHHPLFFSDDELALLEGTLALEMIEHQKMALAAEWEHLVGHLRGLEFYGYEAFVWARIAVQTRTFGMNIYEQQTDALVPLADLMNHSLTPDVRWTFDSARGGFLMTAEDRIPAGAPLRDAYGNRSNSRLFSTYGFCIDENPANEARLRFDAEDVREFTLVADESNEDVVDMLEFVRAQPAPAAALKRACETALAAFPTTVAEDDAQLSRADLSVNARNAIRVRRGEKQILHHFLDLMDHP